MIKEITISKDEFMNDLNFYLSEIFTSKKCYLVIDSNAMTEVPEKLFVIGPPIICTNVIGLVNEEYGWPFHINIKTIKSITDLTPGYHKHPFIYDENKLLAISVKISEFELIKEKIADTD